MQNSNTLQLDPTQFDALLKAIDGSGGVFSPSNIIAFIAVLVALLALVASYFIFRQQQKIERGRYAAQLHEAWWSDDLDAKRHVVWVELEKWEKLGSESPAIQYYSGGGGLWPVDSVERKAHARVLFFFSDLNRLIEHGLIEENIAFEMFGVAQYEWFRPYFVAIRETVKARQPAPDKRPRFVAETEAFEKRLDAWKARRKLRS